MSKFNKVSFGRYNFDTTRSRVEYDNIQLPKRSTKKSAGYDFFLPCDITIPFGGSVLLYTGINVELKDDEFLMILPRSGQGFKYGVHLANTAGVIDADYIDADNEGHIAVKLVNDSLVAKGKDIVLSAGTAFCQGIISVYRTTEDDDAEGERTGGFGSTDKK